MPDALLSPALSSMSPASPQPATLPRPSLLPWTPLGSWQLLGPLTDPSPHSRQTVSPTTAHLSPSSHAPSMDQPPTRALWSQTRPSQATGSGHGCQLPVSVSLLHLSPCWHPLTSWRGHSPNSGLLCVLQGRSPCPPTCTSGLSLTSQQLPAFPAGLRCQRCAVHTCGSRVYTSSLRPCHH